MARGESMLLRRAYNDCGLKNRITRERWLAAVLRRVPGGTRILDVGAGELQYKKFCAHLEYVSQDLGEYDGSGDRRGLQTERWDTSKVDIRSDITSITEPDGSFGAIMCIEVLEHVPEPRLAIREFARLLKEDGILILTVPVCSLTHFAPYYFYNGFSRYFFEALLPEHGLAIEELSANGNFFEYLAQELHRVSLVGSRYARMGVLRRLTFRLCSLGVLIHLGRLSKHDSGSDELLCHGLHIVARKRA